MTVSNPFQEIFNMVQRVESTQEKIMRLLTDKEEKPGEDLPIGIDEACKITGLAKPTIYSKFSRREIPGYRRGQRLYFYRRELLEWINSGKRSTIEEIKADALNSLERGAK